MPFFAQSRSRLKRGKSPKMDAADGHDGQDSSEVVCPRDHAAVKIQSMWRGKRERRAFSRRRARKQPFGFYTHTLGLTYVPQTKRESAQEDMPWKKRAYLLFDDPGSSNAAYFLSLFCVLMIMFSILGATLETVFDIYYRHREAFMIMEMLCTLVFSFEYGIRLFVCNEGGLSKCQFVLAPMNIVDLLAVTPFYVDVVMGLVGTADSPALKAFRVVRLVRVFRILKLGRYASGMILMATALRNSSQAISVLVFLLCMGVVLFSSAVFYAEKLSCPGRDDMSDNQILEYTVECAEDFNRGRSPTYGLCCTEYGSPNDFPSVLSACWWAMVTMTTVGYGDVYPRTFLGKCVGFVAMLVGMLLVALPVAIVGQKFQDVYESHDLSEAKHRAAARMKIPQSSWTLQPTSNVIQRLRDFKIKDRALAGCITDVTACLEEVWEQREQLRRLNQLKVEKHEGISELMLSVLGGIESPPSPDSKSLESRPLPSPKSRTSSHSAQASPR